MLLLSDGTNLEPTKVGEIDSRIFFRSMGAFTFGFMQDVIAFFIALERKKIPIEFALGAIEYRQSITDEQWRQDINDKKIWDKKARKCPDCGMTLSFSPINIPEGPGNRKGHKGVWYCTTGWAEDEPEKICGHVSYTRKSINYYFRKYKIKRRIETR